MSFLPVFPELVATPTLIPNVDVVPGDNPIKETINFKNIRAGFSDFSQDRVKQKWEYPKRDFTLKYTWITKAEALIIWNFFIARGGSFESFKFLYPFVNTYENELISICNGVEDVYDLPAVNTTSRTIYKNNVYVDPGEYLFGAEQGNNGEDAIGFYVAPEQGDILTIDFVGNLIVRCRFKDDSMDFETFNNRLSTIGVKLKGLLLTEEFGVPQVTTTTTTTT